MDNLEEKALIRSILLSLGRKATEFEFIKDYDQTTGENFRKLLKDQNKSFFQFMTLMPDVCRVWKCGNEIIVERVATKESSHMNKLTTAIKKRAKGHRLLRSPHQRNLYAKLQSNRYTRARTPLSFQPPRKADAKRNSIPAIPPWEMKTTTYKAASDPDPVEKNVKCLGGFTTNRIQQKEQQKDTSSEQKLLVSKPLFSNSFQMKNPFKIELSDLKKSTLPAAVNPFRNSTQKENIPDVTSLSLKFSALKFNENETRKETRPLTFNENKVRKETRPLFRSAMDEIKKQTENGVKNRIEGLAAFVTSGYSVPHLHLELNRSSLVKVKLMEHISPSQFVFQVNQEALQQMTNEMNSFYNSSLSNEHLRVKKAFKGLTVAALKGRNWLRGEVLVMSDDDAFVHFVDFGSRDYVKITNIRFLKKSFASSARHSCKGSLNRVYPNPSYGTLWNVAAIMEFVGKTENIELFASVTGRKEGVYELDIYEDKNKRSNLSDFMIRSGYAVNFFVYQQPNLKSVTIVIN